RQPPIQQGRRAMRRADRHAHETGGNRRIRPVGEEISGIGRGRENDLFAGTPERVHARRRPAAGSVVSVSARRLFLLEKWWIHLLWRDRQQQLLPLRTARTVV